MAYSVIHILVFPEQAYKNSTSVPVRNSKQSAGAVLRKLATSFFRLEERFSYAEDGRGRFLKKYYPTLQTGRTMSFAVLVPIYYIVRCHILEYHNLTNS
jgi:hypothetical protein